MKESNKCCEANNSRNDNKEKVLSDASTLTAQSL